MLEQKISVKMFHSKAQLKIVLALISSMNSDRTLIFNKLKFFAYDKFDPDKDLLLDKQLFDHNIYS